MILDKHLTFVKGMDAPAAETRAVCLAQADLTGTTDGMGPYDGLFLVVTAADRCRDHRLRHPQHRAQGRCLPGNPACACSGRPAVHP